MMILLWVLGVGLCFVCFRQESEKEMPKWVGVRVGSFGGGGGGLRDTFMIVVVVGEE